MCMFPNPSPYLWNHSWLVRVAIFQRQCQKLGLPIQRLDMVFVAVILSHGILCIRTPSLEAHLTRQLQERLLDAFLKRAIQIFCDANYTMANYLTRQMLGFLGLYKDQNTVFIIFYQLTVVLRSWDTEVIVFSFLSVNIICIKTPLFRGVCLNTFIFRRLYIFKYCYVCPCSSCDACVCRAQINVYLLTYLLTYGLTVVHVTLITAERAPHRVRLARTRHLRYCIPFSFYTWWFIVRWTPEGVACRISVVAAVWSQ